MNEVEQARITEIMLDFFGQVTASATHEIKNGLAVMNEQSRLIFELIELSRQGRELDVDRLGALIGRVIDRIDQTDQVVRRLNKFAHSADLDRDGGDANKILTLMARFHERLASIKGVSLAVADEPLSGAGVRKAVIVELAVWTCLEAMVAAADKGSRINLDLIEAEGSLKLRFRGELSAAPEIPPAWLLKILGATAEGFGQEGLDLTIPSAGGG